MDKVLIEVYVPLIARQFSIFVPVNKKINELIVLLDKAVNEITNGNYPTKEFSALCSKTSGKIYNNDLVVKDSDLLNGSKVILVWF